MTGREPQFKNGSKLAQRLRVLAIAAALISSSDRSHATNSSDCFEGAARYYAVNAQILRAIAIRETSHCSAKISRNSDGSVDVGCMQINSIHFAELAKHGITPHDLLDNCTNIFVAAWHYRRQIARFGNTWQAVGAYHSRTPSKRDKYARDIYQIYIRLQDTSPYGRGH